MSRVYTLYLPHPIPRAGFSLNRRQPEPSDRSRHPRPPPPAPAHTPVGPLSLPHSHQRPPPSYQPTTRHPFPLSLSFPRYLRVPRSLSVSLSRLISLFTCLFLLLLVLLRLSKPSLSPSRALFSLYTLGRVCGWFLRARVQRFAFSFPQ